MNALIVALTLVPLAKTPSVTYETFKFGAGKYHMVTADLRNEEISMGALHCQRLTSVRTMLSPTKPVAAITGTFFNPRSQRPVADVVVDGKLVARGNRGSAVAVDWYGKVHILDHKFKEGVDWLSYKHLIRGAVRIVSNGKLTINPKGQSFRDSGIWGRAARSAVGVGKDGRLVLLATCSSVSLGELGKAMMSRGIEDAVSLDGGGSTCLYYRGSLVIPPKRKLSNLFVVYENAAP